MSKSTIVLDGYTLTLEDINNFIENKDIVVEISEKALETVRAARTQLEKWLKEDGKVIYGVTTGLGKLKDFMVGEEEQALFQKNTLYSHAVGIGPYFHNDISRLAMLLRANVLCRGNSGVRVELVERILMF